MNPYAKDDIRYTPTPEETVEGSKAVTLDAVKNFYQNYYGASNGELVVVGDHDSAEMQALAAKLFGDWKSPKPYAIVPWPYNPVQALNKSFETPD
jgi:zinc protease